MIMFLYIVLLLLSAFLVMVVLLQRGRGAGLAGAFGAGGGTSSAFGTKTGDVFTWVTVVAFVLFMVLSITLFMKIKWGSRPDQTPGRDSLRVKADQDDAVDIKDTSLTLVWRDNSSNCLGYHILRAEVQDNRLTDYVLLPANVPANSANGQYSYADSGLTPGTTYYYQVEAWNNSDRMRSPSYNEAAKSGGQLHALRATTTGIKPLALPPANAIIPTVERLATAPVSATASAPATGAASTSAPATPASAPASNPATTSAPATTTQH